MNTLIFSAFTCTHTFLLVAHNPQTATNVHSLQWNSFMRSDRDGNDKTVSITGYSLTKKDVVILWGGSNDVAKNETVIGLRHLRKFVNSKKNTNFILVTAPHRYDLMDSSCVNEEIKVFNRKVHKIMKLENNVKILNINLDRSCYTRHGLHLNATGKERMIEMIINQLQSFSIKDKGNVISQNWAPNLDEYCQEEGIDNISIEDEKPQQ